MRQKSVIKKAAARLLGLVLYVVQVIPVVLFQIRVKVSFIKGRYLEFVPRPDDIFIASYPRSGTTLMQMMLYQLSTDGSMNFKHISQHIPYFERAFAYGADFEDMPSPRIFKTHLPYKSMPRQGRMIYIARDGRDVAVSYYHFQRTHNQYRGEFPDFFQKFVRGKLHPYSWFKHVKGWGKHRHDSNVLFLHYEDLINDLGGCALKVADFCGFKVDPRRLPQIVEACSFDYMKKYEEKFDHLTQLLMDEGVKKNSFIRKGQAGGWKELLSPDEAALFEREFARQLGEPGTRLNPGARNLDRAA